MAPNLDTELCKQLAQHVEVLTTSGKLDLDSEILKKIKKICRLSDDYVKHTYHLLIYQLEADHAEIRFSSLQICDELFRRSHKFRELLVSEFQTFLELCVETDPDQPLPPPLSVGKKLKSKALECIRQWHQAYGEGYTKLKLGYNFLKECKKIDFDNIYARGAAERRHEEERQKRIEIVNQDRLNKCMQEMEETVPEINSCLNQIHECLKLLAPDPLQIFSEVDFDKPQPCCSKSLSSECHVPRIPIKITDNEVGNETLKHSVDECMQHNEETNKRNPRLEEDLIKDDDWMRQHGIANMKYNLTVEIKPENLQLKITSDNSPLVDSLQEFHSCLSQKHAKKITAWIQALVKGSGPAEKLKILIDLKNQIELTLKKCTEFGIGSGNFLKVFKEEDDDDDDDDFEEVESKEGFEPIIPLHRRYEYGLEPQPSTSNRNLLSTNKEWQPSPNKHIDEELQDPASSVLNIKRLNEICMKKGILAQSGDQQLVKVKDKIKPLTNSLKSILLDKAPKLRFDADLLNWGEEMSGSAPARILKLESLHRFWQPIHNEISETVKPEEAAALRTRVIEFSGKFEQVKWQCRAPLKNGKLCPRRDRQKCPFHGPVIPRDSTGTPSNEEDRKQLKKQQEDQQRENPEWQDPTFLKEIESATGVNLTVSKRKKAAGSKANKKRKYPGLTDLNANQSTSRIRLEKIVFDKGSVKRVAETLDHLDYKKFTDKFGNQFNYSCLT